MPSNSAVLLVCAALLNHTRSRLVPLSSDPPFLPPPAGVDSLVVLSRHAGLSFLFSTLFTSEGVLISGSKPMLSLHLFFLLVSISSREPLSCGVPQKQDT